MNITVADLADLLKHAREDASLTQKELADLIECTHATVSLREHGESLHTAVEVLGHLEACGWKIVVRASDRRLLMTRP